MVIKNKYLYPLDTNLLIHQLGMSRVQVVNPINHRMNYRCVNQCTIIHYDYVITLIQEKPVNKNQIKKMYFSMLLQFSAATNNDIIPTIINNLVLKVVVNKEVIVLMIGHKNVEDGCVHNLVSREHFLEYAITK